MKLAAILSSLNILLIISMKLRVFQFLITQSRQRLALFRVIADTIFAPCAGIYFMSCFIQLSNFFQSGPFKGPYMHQGFINMVKFWCHYECRINMEHYGQHIFVIFSAYSKRDKICLKNEKKYNCKLVSCNSGMITKYSMWLF